MPDSGKMAKVDRYRDMSVRTQTIFSLTISSTSCVTICCMTLVPLRDNERQTTASGWLLDSQYNQNYTGNTEQV